MKSTLSLAHLATVACWRRVTGGKRPRNRRDALRLFLEPLEARTLLSSWSAEDPPAPDGLSPDGLSPDVTPREAGFPRPDTLGRPTAIASQPQTRGRGPQGSPPAGQRPYGAAWYDTSEYMLGDVWVTVVLLESDHTLAPYDAETEDWSSTEITNVKNEIAEGLQWWEDTLANMPAPTPLNHLDFHIDFTYADNPVRTGYEPINRPFYDEEHWIEDFVEAAGAPTTGDYFVDMAHWDDSQRLLHNADWAFTVFVVDSSADGNGMFSDGYYAYAYVGGPFGVMTYDNDGWGIGSMGIVMAHETGHIFFALDEYQGSNSYTARSGYYNTQNLNAYDGNPKPSSRVNSLMAEYTLEVAAYAAHTSSPTSLQMVGWKDSDADGIFDVLDVPLSLTGSGSYNAAAGRYEFSGTSSVQALNNLNPRSMANDITLNKVDRIQYRLDGGAWTDGNSYGLYSTAVSQNVPVSPGQHTIEFRTIYVETGLTSNVISDTFGQDTTPPSVTVASLITSDTTPAITGAVSDGTLQVAVNSKTYTAGDGNLSVSGTEWTLQIPPADALPLGVYDVAASATDTAGNTGTDGTSGELQIVRLMVTGLTPTANGFLAEFNGPVDPSVLNLYDQEGALGPADVTLIGNASGPVRGSLVVEPGLCQMTFIKTASVLPPDTYTVTLLSGVNAFRTSAGQLLDGNSDGTPGDDFVTTFVVSAPPANAITVSLPDFARGYGQSVNLPADNPSAGLPLTINDGSTVSQVELTLDYDPGLLNVQGFTLNPDLAARGATAAFNVSPPGTGVLTVTAPVGVSLGASAGPLAVGAFTAQVPDTATYAAKEILDLANVHVYDLAAPPTELPAVDDDAIHLAAYFGDANGGQSYNAADAILTQRIMISLNSGLSAYPMVDPILAADITLNDALGSNDVTGIQRAMIQIPVANIPDLPTGLTPPPTSGLDPRLYIPQDLSGMPGGTVTVPVRVQVTESAGITIAGLLAAVAFDETKFTVSSVQLGTLTAGWGAPQVNSTVPGKLLITASDPVGAGLLPVDTDEVLFTIAMDIHAGAAPGSFPINLLQYYARTITTLTDNDLNDLVLAPAQTNADNDEVDGLVTIAPATLQVTGVAATASGFVAQFNRDLDRSVLNLYDGAGGTLGPADVILKDSTNQVVAGSIVVDSSLRFVTFVKTGGVLPPDTYMLTLKSGAAAFREADGASLDGNRDGTTGDDFTASFTVAASSDRVVSIPDLARGAGQSVNIPNAAAGLPIRIDDADGVTSLAVDLVYDQSLLQITAAILAAGMPTDWSVDPPDTGTPGMAKIRAFGTTPLSGTNVEVVRLTAAVPSDAPYGAVQAIRLENVSLNGGGIAAVGDVAVHKAVYLGDADGSGIHSSADAFLTVQAALGLASGFAAHAWTDPRMVGDADGSGVLSAADAFLIVQEGLGLSEPFVPDNPHITVTPVGGGVDPQFQIGEAPPVSADGGVSVPVKLDIEAAATNVGGFDFDLFFDPTQLTIQLPGGVATGADTAGWAMSSALMAGGHLRVGMVSSRGQSLATGLREIARLQFRVAESATDVPTALDLEPLDPGAGGYVWTASDGSLRIEPAPPPQAIRHPSSKLRIPSTSSRIPTNSGGRGHDASFAHAPSSWEFGYAQLPRPQARCAKRRLDDTTLPVWQSDPFDVAPVDLDNVLAAIAADVSAEWGRDSNEEAVGGRRSPGTVNS